MQDIKMIEKDSTIEVNLSNIKHNLFNVLKSKIKEDTKVIAVVKSNAYGHGLIQVSKYLENINVDYLGVFSITEGVNLRLNGLKKEILIFGAVKEKDIDFLFDYKLTPLIGTLEEFELINKLNNKNSARLPIHIKIDTGMGRIGFLPDEAFDIIKNIYYHNDKVSIEGICTHFSDSSSSDPKYTYFQANIFQRILDRLSKLNIKIPTIHASNSAAILKYPEFQYNCVRPGILLYGISPFDDDYNLKPALSLSSRIITIKDLPSDSYLSYNRTYKTKISSKIALIPLGYGDGITEKLSNKGEVIVNGLKYPIVGSVCMNQFLVDVTNGQNIKSYDKVILIGTDKGQTISVKDISKIANMIPYEILCRLSEELLRVYKE